MKLNTPITRFISDTKRYPMLSPEREHEIALLWRESGDQAALAELIGSHLRLVVKTARSFDGYGRPLADLVAEGNLGLLQAAYRFDPDRGARFATYAVWWIRAAIQEHILHSWSLVKIGTTSAQKKLFFNLRCMKAHLQDSDQADLRPETATVIARELAVAEKDVIEMSQRLAGSDHSLNAAFRGESDFEWIEFLPDERPDPETALGDIEEARQRRERLSSALRTLTPRERDIINERRLRENPISLGELSQRYRLSRERVRQIEMAAIGKLQKVLTADQELEGQRIPSDIGALPPVCETARRVASAPGHSVLE